MNSYHGVTWGPAGRAGFCQSWRRDVRGTHSHYLSDGDILCVSLCDDRSVSITYNNTEVTQVFTELPDKPLWVVIWMRVRKMQIIHTGKIYPVKLN